MLLQEHLKTRLKIAEKPQKRALESEAKISTLENTLKEKDLKIARLEQKLENQKRKRQEEKQAHEQTIIPMRQFLIDYQRKADAPTPGTSKSPRVNGKR